VLFPFVALNVFPICSLLWRYFLKWVLSNVFSVLRFPQKIFTYVLFAQLRSPQNFIGNWRNRQHKRRFSALLVYYLDRYIPLYFQRNKVDSESNFNMLMCLTKFISTVEMKSSKWSWWCSINKSEPFSNLCNKQIFLKYNFILKQNTFSLKLRTW